MQTLSGVIIAVGWAIGRRNVRRNLQLTRRHRRTTIQTQEEDEARAFSGAVSAKPKSGPSNSARHKGGQYDTLEGWLADSGSSHHATYSPVGLYDFQPADNVRISTPNSSSQIEGYGKLDLAFTDKHDEECVLTLNNVAYVPDFDFNFFSLVAMAEKGHSYHGTNKGVFVNKPGLSIVR